MDDLIRNNITVATLCKFYEHLVDVYAGKQIYLVQDNWSVHYHPDLLAALQVQHLPYGLHAPVSWKEIKPSKKYKGKNLPIQLLSLPTYASWLNVIEKLWRKLKQELLHMHPWKDQFDTLKLQIAQWLDQYKKPDQQLQLIKYVGLLKPDNFFGKLINQIYPTFKERVFCET